MRTFSCHTNVNAANSERVANQTESKGAFHLVKISGISGSAVNGTRFVGSCYWKIPRKSGKSKKVGPFSRLKFPNGMSCSIYLSRICTSSRSTVGHRDVPVFTTKWNNFLPIWNSTFAPTEISVFFGNGKGPRIRFISAPLADLSRHMIKPC